MILVSYATQARTTICHLPMPFHPHRACPEAVWGPERWNGVSEKLKNSFYAFDEKWKLFLRHSRGPRRPSVRHGGHKWPPQSEKALEDPVKRFFLKKVAEGGNSSQGNLFPWFTRYTNVQGKWVPHWQLIPCQMGVQWQFQYVVSVLQYSSFSWKLPIKRVCEMLLETFCLDMYFV